MRPAWLQKKPYKKSLVTLNSKDINFTLGGRLKEDYFFYNRVRTLSDNFFDQNDFFRHKLQLDFNMKQGEKRYGTPATEAGIRLTNYVVWQQNNYYTPFSRDNIRSLDLDSVITANNVTVKTLMPLIFVEEGWFKLNLNTFWHTFNKNPTYLKVGFFKYFVGRGISLGYHNDLAVEYLGWPGQGDFTRYPQMPPGILLHSQILKDLALELYFMKWRENDANLEDVTAPTRAQRLGSKRTERGTDKDRNSWVVRFQYTPEDKGDGEFYAEPYWIYTRAPDQVLEFDSDASSRFHTFGAMLEYKKKGFDVNVELAGQTGHQNVHCLDRNVKMLNRRTSDGSVQECFSHIVLETSDTKAAKIPSNLSRDKVPVKNLHAVSSDNYEPGEDLGYIVNSMQNRDLCQQGKQIVGGVLGKGGTPAPMYNSNLFGNARFRAPYKLDLNGFMFMADVGYTFEHNPFRIAASFGHISGDNYPYNDECSKTYHGFIPQRSRYKGHDVRSTLIFDRLVIPRPLNIAYRTMYAFNNLKDVSNLELLGFGGTWYPFRKEEKGALTANLIFFWEDANLYKWDKCGHHPDPLTEAQIAYDRARLGFRGVNPSYKAVDYYKNNKPDPTNSGWLSNEKASRFLGAEIDLKGELKLVDECRLSGKICGFIPGQLYRDLDGQPNELTQYVDPQGLSHYESLGNKFAYAFIVGLDYLF
jgi:hypothetical protein